MQEIDAKLTGSERKPSARTIALINQKGGVGKTTSAVNIGACLAALGKRCLMIDLDPQANMSLHYGVRLAENDSSIYSVLAGRASLQEVARPVVMDGLHLAPASIDLAGAEVELVGVPGRELILREALEPLYGDFDYILVDCPPSLGLLTINALTAVREVFIPLQTEFFALQGISKLLETVHLIQRRLNQELCVTGIIPCLFDCRTTLAAEVLGEVRRYFGDKVFDTRVRKNVRLAEAPSHGLPIIRYSPASHGAEDYTALTLEVAAMEEPPPAVPEDNPVEEVEDPDQSPQGLQDATPEPAVVSIQEEDG